MKADASDQANWPNANPNWRPVKGRASDDYALLVEVK